MAKEEEQVEEVKKRQGNVKIETEEEPVEEEILEAGTEEAATSEEQGGGELSESEPRTEEAGTEADDGKTGAKKSLFGKKEKKDKLDPLKEQVKELQDRCMRQMAEFENFRKRTDKEKSQMFDTGAAHVIEKILPVVDNFERGLTATPEADRGGAFAEGMDKIYKQLYKVLEDLGVTPIEALGEEFDPNFHNAVMQTEATEDYPSGTVAQEMQKGYLYHDTVIRHSMVAVAE